MSIQRIRVPLGFLFAAAYLYWSEPRPVWIGIGLAIGLLGLGVRVWAAGHLRKWKGLAVSGPYRHTRNPLYLGSLILGLGLTIASTRFELVLVFVVLFLSVYLPVMRKEEEELRQSYGASFEHYREQVPLLFPRPGHALPGGPQQRFDWSRFLANREYNAVIGVLIVALFLFLRMGWR